MAKLPEEQREPARVARSTAADKRTEEQQKLLRDFPSLNVDRGSAILYDNGRITEFNKKYEAMQAEIKTKRPAELFAPCFSEVPNQQPSTFLFYRGDFQQPRDPIPPGGLSILGEHERILADDPAIPTSGRRLQFARLLTQGTHPLFARAIVNRLWMNHFGRGLSSNPGDLGRLGERPTHPELLDWLARDLSENGWDRKRFTREIVLSAVYRQASLRTPEHQEKDPLNDWYSHMNIRRLSAEAVRDAMLATAQITNRRMFGPPTPVNPDDVGQFILGKATRDGNGLLVAKAEEIPDVYRRSIYVQIRRSMPLGVLEPFDPATMNPNCDRRNQSTVATQSLMLMNNSTVIKLSEHFATRVLRESGDDIKSQIENAWRSAFGTLPMPNRSEQLVRWVTELKAQLSTPESDPAKIHHQAMALLCQAFMSSNSFLYVE